MTEQDYLTQISSCEQAIQRCLNEINTKNRQIEELQAMIAQFRKISQTLESAANAGNQKIRSIVSLFAAAGSYIKGQFFNQSENLYTGAEYKKACTSIEESSQRTYRKIDELQEEIRALYREISNYETQISESKSDLAALATESGE